MCVCVSVCVCVSLSLSVCVKALCHYADREAADVLDQCVRHVGLCCPKPARRNVQPPVKGGQAKKKGKKAR